MKDREKMLLAFFLKAGYDLPTTKVLLENLTSNPGLKNNYGARHVWGKGHWKVLCRLE